MSDRAVRTEDASEREVSVALTGVFTDPGMPGPAVTPLPRAEVVLVNTDLPDGTGQEVLCQIRIEDPSGTLAAWLRGATVTVRPDRIVRSARPGTVPAVGR